ncbi:hypothetical protein FE257_001500 [Aspergillus nanangensis]|uniref:Zn(2)-C6 fungal-type domain-containing protein n=1 Tax=Aspergillus nanangensis TaxID=2582783 RepID=A0AAD4CDP7_ASPNN|nr:hypothetical protein FE257_001500 [Aspergillus nanangensis]
MRALETKPRTNAISMDVNTTTAHPKSRSEGTATGARRRRIRPSRARGLRTRTGCLTCRERRVKCDDGKPTCMRCSKSDRICRYAQQPVPDCQSPTAQPNNVREKTTGEDDTIELCLPQRQVPSIDRQAYFQPADASGSLPPDVPIQTSRHDYLHRSNNNDQTLSRLESDASTSPLSLSQISLLNISPFEWYDLLARDAISNIQRLNGGSTSDPRWKFPELTLSRRQSPAPEWVGAHFEHGEPSSEIPAVGYHPVEEEPWNTTHRIELSPVDMPFFRYYIEVVGPILDLFDPDRHFSNVVPHLALRNTGLLKSILAVGARHMSLGLQRRAGEDVNTPASVEEEPGPAHTATEYYYQTLQYLSQTLLYPSYADSREILATATMISTYEMFDADTSSISGDWEQHLRGSFWIQRSQDNDGESVDGLRRAVWWAWLRQDIWAAFQAGRPTLTFWRPKKRLEELNSDELATRIVYICGKCVEYAACDEMSPDQDPRPRIEQGDRLLRALDNWHRILPASYQPVPAAVDMRSNPTMCPPIWIHPPSHAGAMQMYHFARSTVLLNQPTMGGLNAYRLRDAQLAESVKMVCGIANACHEHESAMAFVNVQALFGGKCLPVSLPVIADTNPEVGQFVRSPEMREALLPTLERMLTISKFPARGLVAELEKVWGGG